MQWQRRSAGPVAQISEVTVVGEERERRPETKGRQGEIHEAARFYPFGRPPARLFGAPAGPAFGAPRLDPSSARLPEAPARNAPPAFGASRSPIWISGKYVSFADEVALHDIARGMQAALWPRCSRALGE